MTTGLDNAQWIIKQAAQGQIAAAEGLLRLLADSSSPGMLRELREQAGSGLWRLLLEYVARGTWANRRPRLAAGLGPRLRGVIEGLLLVDEGSPADSAKVAALHEALSDRQPEVRLVAARLLARRAPTAETVQRLIPLLRDPSAKVRGQAALALGATGRPEAAPALVEALADPHGLVVRDAQRALSLLGDAAAAELVASLHDERPHLRCQAARALGHLPHACLESVPRLVQALRDPENSVRWAAADTLISCGDAAVPDLLRACLRPDFDGRLKEYVLYVLENQASKRTRQLLEPLTLALRDLDYRIEAPLQARQLLERWPVVP